MVYAVFLVDSNEKYTFTTWQECDKFIRGKNARYKKFDDIKKANLWLDSGANYDTKKKDSILLDKNGIYFDAGTGRGIGVEVRLSDYLGNSILNLLLDKNRINPYGNYLLENRTNNFGELYGLYFALMYAKKYGIKNIYGDSELVIKYWANGICNYTKLDDDTKFLIKKVNTLYIEYMKKGGNLTRISGDINPSDLGFHK